jgi:hypothetical protein
LIKICLKLFQLNNKLIGNTGITKEKTAILSAIKGYSRNRLWYQIIFDLIVKVFKTFGGVGQG